MGAQEHLAIYDVTMQEARNFIMENLSDLQTVYSVCKQYGVTNSMIAEIVQDDFPDLALTRSIVSDFFDANGFDGSALDASSVVGEGNLDIANIASYEEVALFENISYNTATFIVANNYNTGDSEDYDAYFIADSNAILSPVDYGFNFLEFNGSEYGYPDYSVWANTEGYYFSVTGLATLNQAGARATAGSYDLLMAQIV